jgi:hypothetical protein
MLIIWVLLIAAIAISVLLGRDNVDRGMAEFCKIECPQPPQRKYKFCCDYGD